MADSKFTTSEMRLFCVMVANLKGEMNTDWEKVAETLGYKSASVAKCRFGNIVRSKMKGEQQGSSDGGNGKTAKAASSGKSNIRKANVPKHADGDSDKVARKKSNGMADWKVVKPRSVTAGGASDSDEGTVIVKREPKDEKPDLGNFIV